MDNQQARRFEIGDRVQIKHILNRLEVWNEDEITLPPDDIDGQFGVVVPSPEDEPVLTVAILTDLDVESGDDIPWHYSPLELVLVDSDEAQASATAPTVAAGGERSLKLGQLVRYVGQPDEIPYGSFGVVAEQERVTDWYGIKFFDIEGVRSVKDVVLQTVKPENVNRAQAELSAARQRVDELTAALEPFADAGSTIIPIDTSTIEVLPEEQLVIDENIIKEFRIKDTVTIGHFLNAARLLETDSQS